MEINVQIYHISKFINYSFSLPLKGVFRGFQGGKRGIFRGLPDNVICTFLIFINIKHHQKYIDFTFRKI